MKLVIDISEHEWEYLNKLVANGDQLGHYERLLANGEPIVNKALEQEPTTKNDLEIDCIQRQSVLDKIQRLIGAEQNNIDENGDYMNYARERVNAYEAVQFFVENDCLCPSVAPQESKWIPVSEMLPKKNVEVLATTIWGAVTIAEMFSANDWLIHEGATNAGADDIVAWMPLPKPYKAESEDKE